MSRFEGGEYDGPPPGVNPYIRGPDGMGGPPNVVNVNAGPTGGSPTSGGYGGLDRRGYQMYANAMLRSMGGPADWENGWEGAGQNGPNRSNTASSILNHHHTSPPPPSSNSLYALGDTRNPAAANNPERSTQSPVSAVGGVPSPAQQASTTPARTVLWWGDLEPWMDEEYAKQVCKLMGWEPIGIKVPQPPPDPATGQALNNPGYCFLTFSTPANAAAVLAQIANNPAGAPMTMPNSAKPFNLNWASAVPASSMPLSPSAQYTGVTSGQNPQFPKEFSIFVGDLAPETSNSDLVAVFRNPVLGLRSDREPKFIRPFLSCKSAKIMLDPVTGISRGYGFVRFTDEGDQQRALVEMHGLYCLSRPMRISPATAKFKPTTVMAGPDLSQLQYPPAPTPHQMMAMHHPAMQHPAMMQMSHPSHASLHSMSSGSASSFDASSSGTGLSSNTSVSNNSLNSAAFNSVDDMINLPHHVLAQIAKQYATGEREPPKPPQATSSITSQFADRPPSQPQPGQPGQRYFSEESWKHHNQAQAILSNLIGPNGEQLTSSDPYNTTVFVGGLSPLISEDTLRTFFAPFGDIHYVKVPVGKHCGFVQFVRKTDAERAIEKMQGFPIGGSRIRLSWGRSQYKAAQAAAQAAQAAALQSHLASAFPLLTPEQLQAIQLMKLNQMNGGQSPPPLPPPPPPQQQQQQQQQQSQQPQQVQLPHVSDKEAFLSGHHQGASRELLDFGDLAAPNQAFSPFSPEAAAYGRRDSVSNGLPHPSKSYAPGFYEDIRADSAASILKSALDARPNSANRYYLSGSPPVGNVNRGHMSRPSSGHPMDMQQEFDAMHDLNGTLASLDLDRERPWKSPAESSDSGASVQFQMTMNPTSP